jgi:hypothetical protein
LLIALPNPLPLGLRLFPSEDLLAIGGPVEGGGLPAAYLPGVDGDVGGDPGGDPGEYLLPSVPDALGDELGLLAKDDPLLEGPEE